MKAVTRTGTTVKRFQKAVKSETSGSNLGIGTPPLINFMIEIPAVIMRNTTARATDKADVNFKESAKKKYNNNISEPNLKIQSHHLIQKYLQH